MTDPPRPHGVSPGKLPSTTPASIWRSGWLPGGFIGLALALWLVPWVKSTNQAAEPFQDLPSGGVVLVVQPGDCPDRTRTLTRWLEGIRRQEAGAGPGESVPVGVAVLGPADVPLPPLIWAALDGLPRLDEPEAGRAARALRGMAVEGSPALLVVDGRGRPVLASDFTPEGTMPGLATALAVNPRVPPPFPSPAEAVAPETR